MESFRTETLPSFEPAGKKNDTTNSMIDDIESTMALDNFIVQDIANVNTRAGLYIHLNALVSAQISRFPNKPLSSLAALELNIPALRPKYRTVQPIGFPHLRSMFLYVSPHPIPARAAKPDLRRRNSNAAFMRPLYPRCAQSSIAAGIIFFPGVLTGV